MLPRSVSLQEDLPGSLQESGVIHNILTRRLSAERKAVSARGPVSNPFRAMTDFSTLPGMEEIDLQRSAAAAMGVENPFFRVHDERAGPSTVIAGKSYLNFSSYDYLGLNGHPGVQAAASEAIAKYGTSCSASRLVAGERPIHQELEAALASHYSTESAVVFTSGHATNVSVIGALLGPRDLIVHDSLAHNSIILGATLSGATRRAFAHNDLGALDRVLASCRAQYDRVLVVAEGLYSMDGDCADVAALVELKNRHGAWLMIDEAHSLGVLGHGGLGSFEHCRVNPNDVDIWMGTLSKALSGCGGYIAGCSALIEYLKCTSGGFVYSVGLPPPLAAASLASLRLLRGDVSRVANLRRNSSLFWNQARAHKLDVGLSEGHAIIPVICRSSIVAATLSQRLFERGVNVQPIIYPAVPDRNARLRFFLSSEHTVEQIVNTVKMVAQCIAQD